MTRKTVNECEGNCKSPSVIYEKKNNCYRITVTMVSCESGIFD